MKKIALMAITCVAANMAAPANAATYRINVEGTVSNLNTQTYTYPGNNELSSYLSAFKVGDPVSLAFTYNPTGLVGYPERWTTNLVYSYVKLTDIESSFDYAKVDPVIYIATAEIGIGLEPRGGGGEGDSFDFDTFSMLVDGGYNQDSRFSMRLGAYDPTGTALTTNAFDQLIPFDRFPGVGASFTFGDDTGGASFELANLRASIAAVPEPGTWAMMIIGFGSIGAAMRRRRQGAAVRFA